MDSPRDTRTVEAVVRAFVSAGKSLRLYPAASPIPLQSVQGALDALDQFFGGGDSELVLSVTREGFSFEGEPLPSTLGASDLIGRMQDHGVAQLSIVPGCTGDEILEFLTLLDRLPEQIRSEGGVGVAMTGADLDHLQVVEVQLHAVDHLGPAPEEDVDEFLRDLVTNPDRLSAWFGRRSPVTRRLSKKASWNS